MLKKGRVERKSGRIVHRFGAYFVWGEDTRMRKHLAYCSGCEMATPNYSVTGFADLAMRKTRFCVVCHAIVEKPLRWGRAAPSEGRVGVKLEDGKMLDLESDYCDRQPVTVFHCGIPMVMYRNEEFGNRVTEQVYECPACLEERLLKFRRA